MLCETRFGTQWHGGMRTCSRIGWPGRPGTKARSRPVWTVRRPLWRCQPAADEAAQHGSAAALRNAEAVGGRAGLQQAPHGEEVAIGEHPVVARPRVKTEGGQAR